VPRLEPCRNQIELRTNGKLGRERATPAACDFAAMLNKILELA
jgi:hypothetical protein